MIRETHLARLALVSAAVGGLVLSQVAAEASGPPQLDGKARKTLTATFSPKAQDNDKDVASTADKTECSDARCGRLPFVFKPARGVRGNLSLKISWTLPGEDFDLYLAEIAKDGSYSELANCGTFGGTSERIVVAGSDLKPGHKYALVADFFRATGADKVTGTVSFPSTDTIKKVVPASAEKGAGINVNCGLG